MPRRRESEQHYEELRREALEGGSGLAPGLAIFLRRGMASWLQELATWAREAPPARREAGQSVAPLPAGTKGEVVQALAAMILGRECVERA